MFNILLLVGTILLIFSSFALFAGMVVGGVHILFSLILLCLGKDVEATLQSLEKQQQQQRYDDNNRDGGGGGITTTTTYRRQQQQQQQRIIGLEGGRAAPMPEYRIKVMYPIAGSNGGDLQYFTKTFISKNWNIFQDLQVGDIVSVRVLTRHCPGWAALSVDLLPLMTLSNPRKLSSLVLLVITVCFVYFWFLHKVIFQILPRFLVPSTGIDEDLSKFYIMGVCVMLVPIYFATTIYTLTRTDNDGDDVSYHQEGRQRQLLSSSSTTRPPAIMRFFLPRRLAMATRNVISNVWQGLESEKYHRHHHHHHVRNSGGSSTSSDLEEEMMEMLPQRRRRASHDFV